MNVSLNVINKSIILVPDFLLKILEYLKKPFFDMAKADYFYPLNYNNYPPFKIDINLNNLNVILLSSYQIQEE